MTTARAWDSCPTCAANGTAKPGVLQSGRHLGSGDYSEEIPCGTCAEHFKAMDAALAKVAALLGTIIKAESLLDQVVDSHGSRRAPTLDEAQAAAGVLGDAISRPVLDVALAHDERVKAAAFREAAGHCGWGNYGQISNRLIALADSADSRAREIESRG